jgi:hypothetical protein
MEARSKTIESWFAMIEQAQILLPRFQRHEAWRANQIEGILENILQTPSLPIGALLTLDVGDAEPFHSRPISGAPTAQAGARPQMHLLDGQQRMTALWRSLSDHYPDLKVFVRYDNEEVPDVVLERRWEHKGIMRPVWANDPAATLERGLVPVSLLRPGSKGEAELDAWLEKATEDANLQRRIDKFVSKLRARVANYPVPFLSLPVTTDKEVALNVFIKMNTSASPLRDFDIVVAQVEEAMGQSLHDMIADLCTAVPAARDFGDIEDVVLSVGALLLDLVPLKKTYLERGFGAKLLQVWDRVQLGLEMGLEFLREEGIFDERRLPTDAAVVLACALWGNVPLHDVDATGRARVIIRKAIWRACLTDRYIKTQTTRTFADYKVLVELIRDPTSTAEPELFDEVTYKLPEEGELVRAGWPLRKDRLPRAILAMSLRNGGRDFADGGVASAPKLGSREYHHLFPVSILSGDRSDERVNRALNCALITWRTNRNIAAKTPTEYLRQRTDAAKFGEDEVRVRLESHLIPYESLGTDDYETFLARRATVIAERMRRLANGENV